MCIQKLLPLLVAAGLIAISISRNAAAGPDWLEDAIGDAGSTIVTAQSVAVAPGNDGVVRIFGELTGPGAFGEPDDFEDVYQITVTTPAVFQARTFDLGPANQFDHLLWLFDSNGFGVLANDDTIAGQRLAMFGNAADDGSMSMVVNPGTYYIAVSGINNIPLSQSGEIFSFASRTLEISGPDGLGGGDPLLADPLAAWNRLPFPPAYGEYGIELILTTPVPAPASVALLAVGSILHRPRRRNA